MKASIEQWRAWLDPAVGNVLVAVLVLGWPVARFTSDPSGYLKFSLFVGSRASRFCKDRGVMA